ncbi:hypothetical protein SALBM311S_11940 [Streptomyces alboniger]
MTGALAVGDRGAAVFHLLAHGAFKALLFLAAGVIIHAAGTNSLAAMSRMSNLRHRIPDAFWTPGRAAAPRRRHPMSSLAQPLAAPLVQSVDWLAIAPAHPHRRSPGPDRPRRRPVPRRPQERHCSDTPPSAAGLAASALALLTPPAFRRPLHLLPHRRTPRRLQLHRRPLHPRPPGSSSSAAPSSPPSCRSPPSTTPDKGLPAGEYLVLLPPASAAREPPCCPPPATSPPSIVALEVASLPGLRPRRPPARRPRRSSEAALKFFLSVRRRHRRHACIGVSFVYATASRHPLHLTQVAARHPRTSTPVLAHPRPDRRRPHPPSAPSPSRRPPRPSTSGSPTPTSARPSRSPPTSPSSARPSGFSGLDPRHRRRPPLLRRRLGALPSPACWPPAP